MSLLQHSPSSSILSYSADDMPYNGISGKLFFSESIFSFIFKRSVAFVGRLVLKWKISPSDSGNVLRRVVESKLLQINSLHGQW